jgi:predicted nucleic acid-binding protein
MRSALFDTSVYISVLRGGSATGSDLRRLTGDATVWLSAVVIEELYAGATERDQSVVEELELEFARAGRILVPDLIDWSITGRVLRGWAGKYDYEPIGCGRLTNDALIAVSAGRTGITVLTAKPRDFGKLSEFYSFQWHVAGA